MSRPMPVGRPRTRCDDAAMVEYGGTVGQGSGAIGGRVGPSDMTGQVMNAFSDIGERIATLPPLVLVLIAAAMLVSWLVWSKRTM